MSQFAARASKPILAYDPYNKRGTETLTCQVRQVEISKQDMNELLDEAQRLVDDVEYRQARGAEMCSCVMSVDDFNSKFKMAVEQGRPTGITFEINRNIPSKSDSYISNNIKVHALGFSIENQLVSYMGLNAMKVLSFSDVWRYKKKQLS